MKGTILLLVSFIIVTTTIIIIQFSPKNSVTRNGETVEINNRSLIRFNAEGKLKLALFADLHYGEEPSTDWGPRADNKSWVVMGNVLDYEDPDLVVFTGDQLTAENMYPNASEYVHILVKPLVERGYRWASTYGNHDIGPNVTRIEILEAEDTYPDLSYTQRMTDKSVPGITNYNLLVYDEDSEVPVMILWFFDSQGGRNNEGQQPHHIDPKVLAWFEQEAGKLKRLWGPLPSLVFFHIPPVEYIEIQENIQLHPQCSGLVDDDVTPQDKNTGVMTALSKVGGVQAVYVGHDHGDAWCCFYQTIQVCYGRHTGYGGYGTWDRGARIVNLEMTNSSTLNVSSYIRMENGDVIDEFPKP